MTQQAEAEAVGLLRPDHPLHDFQAEAAARGYIQWTESPFPALDVQYDMGLGKTPISLALAALLAEDGLVDRVVIVAEKNKIKDWTDIEVPKFTRLEATAYTGSPERRAEIRANDPQVLVTTYETGRVDLANFKPRSKRAIQSKGALTEWMEGRNVLVIFDEVTRLRNRSSKLHIAWDYAINRVLRKQKDHKVMAVGLTGTKIENNPSDHYNVNRLLAPHLAPSVADFEATYVGGWDKWDNITSWRYLDPATTPLDIMPLSEVFSEITLRKSKTDPDVMDQFPAKMENPPTRVEMGKAQRDFYRELEEILHAEDDEVTGITLLRQIALDPACLIGSDSAFSRRVTEVVGERGLRAIGSAKTDEAVEWARRAGDQQMVMFTFFGQSYLPLVHQRLRDEGFTVVVNHGQMSAKDRQTAQDTYRAGDAQVFLSSDAGARGLNLGVGSALLHLELPPLHAIYEQRSDRIHRINSVHPSVTVDSLLAEGTIEEPIMQVALARNEWAERVSDGGLVEAEDGSGTMTASLRKRIWNLDRERR